MLSLSFFESVLPGLQTNEGKELAAKLTLGNTNANSDVFERILQITKLLLIVVQETGDAMQSKRCKDFDALVGNFGCQLTAFELQRKLRNAGLLEEAVRVREQARTILSGLEQSLRQGNYEIRLTIDELLQKPPNFQLTLLGIMRQAKLDFCISSDLRDLFRFRLLKLINDNKLVGRREVPFTNISRLCEKVDQLSKNKRTVKLLIDGIQLEESEKAAGFIRQVASEMNVDDPRTGMLQRMLSEKFAIKSKGIVSLPLVYNTEACLRNFQGVLLIKNKLADCNGAIQGAVPQRLFLKMPGEIILDNVEIADLPDDELLMVLEGNIMQGVSLAARIKESGLLNIVLSNCAEEPQYANLREGDPGVIKDDEAQQEVEGFKKLKLKSTIFDLDHFYCASMREER